MIRVNDFLADFEAHHAPPSILKYQTAPHARVYGEIPRTLIASKPCLVSSFSLASSLAAGQGTLRISALKSISPQMAQSYAEACSDLLFQLVISEVLAGLQFDLCLLAVCTAEQFSSRCGGFGFAQLCECGDLPIDVRLCECQIFSGWQIVERECSVGCDLSYKKPQHVRCFVWLSRKEKELRPCLKFRNCETTANRCRAFSERDRDVVQLIT